MKKTEVLNKLDELVPQLRDEVKRTKIEATAAVPRRRLDTRSRIQYGRTARDTRSRRTDRCALAPRKRFGGATSRTGG